MKYWEQPRVVFQEVPSEISLAFQITGCTKRCKGCHSTFLWKESGTELTDELLMSYLEKYEGLVSCILFFGGEWHMERLITLLSLCKRAGFKTCLYTGEDQVCSDLLGVLDYIKVGQYISELGGLDSTSTNQKIIRLLDGKLLNQEFIKDNQC